MQQLKDLKARASTPFAIQKLHYNNTILFGVFIQFYGEAVVKTMVKSKSVITGLFYYTFFVTVANIHHEIHHIWRVLYQCLLFLNNG